MLTSKYLRLSSCGIALIPGTLWDVAQYPNLPQRMVGFAYGSAINLSVSFMILFGNAILSQTKGHRRLGLTMRLSYPGDKIGKDDKGWRFVFFCCARVCMD